MPERSLPAAGAPSASNLQPGHAHAPAGGPPAELGERVGERLTSGDSGDEPEHQARERAAAATHHKNVAKVASPPSELILFRGMSIRSEDDTVRPTRTGRAQLDETVAFASR
ncbi:hypothetical protein [Streptomyces sp. NPDC026673]|uniref:hypothetical protein n=1 Tax=Streptomyces sp. NPDC026673 TaxID=3155724 RepID=UPI0033EAA271